MCIGWSRLLGPDLLAIPPKGCVGFHPAALPRNRGRHPIIWALVLGLSETASTLFLMDEGADSGPILSQHPVTITAEDNARTLYDKVTASLSQQLGEALDRLESEVPLQAQDESQASYWRKRSARDGRIDFRMTSTAIHNLVRGLTRPYPGATVDWQGKQQPVWRCVPVEWDQPNVEPGRVLDVSAGAVLVKTSDGAVALTEHEITPFPSKGDYF
jgi:methionyl-tRNA formyltransferase